MTAPFPQLATPLTLRGRTVPNRIASTAHNPNWETDGLISDRHVDYHIRKAAGGAGLIMCFGSANVHEPAASFSESINLWDARNEPALRRLAAGVHAHGALVMSQASHLGHRATSLVSGKPVQAPSEIPQPVRREIPHALREDEITAIVGSFADAARRLEACDWDGIEITSFGGHLIEQFWSPSINRRQDRYGGDLENRIRFSLEVIEAVAEAVSDHFLIGVRLTGDPLTDAVGLSPADMVEIARRLDAVGRIDLFNVSGGTGTTLESQGATVPPDTFPEACYLPAARRMRDALSVPVLAAGRVLTPELGEAALATGDCDLVAMTRAIMADPDLPNRAFAGEVERIRPCLAINEACIGRDYQGLPMLCAVNPAVGHPELARSAPEVEQRDVVVVGGGPAGLEPARAAAEQGHAVLLVEAAERLGGQWAVAALAPERPHLGRNLPFLERELARLGVSVRLAEPAGAAAVLDSQPDVVVVATGAANVVPDEARGAAVPCATDVDLLSGAHPIRPGARVIVFDPEGLNRGASIASWAAEVGAGEVELVTPLLAACQDLDPTQQPSALRRLARNGVTCTPNQALVGVADGAVTVRDQWSDAVRALDADLLVFVGFRRARSALEAELRQARPGVEVQAIGDCVAPRRLHDAVAEGARVGRSIGTIVSPRGMAARQARRRHRGPIG